MHRHALRTVFASLFAFALLAGIAPAGAQTTSPAPVTTGTLEEKAAKITGPSVVYIEQYWTAWIRVPKGSGLYFTGFVNDGQAFEWGTRCSGFIVNPTGYIVTAGHCVDDSEEGARETALSYATQWLIDNGWAYKKDFQYWLDEGHLMWKVEGEEAGSPPDLEVYVQHGIAQGGVKSGDSFPARVVDSQPWSEGDVALLKIEEIDLPSLLLAPDADIDIGTPVLSVGYPGSTDQVTDQSLEPTYKDGQINAKKTREGGLLPVYEMSAALSGGMSGGPTVNLQGEVVGVNSFGIVGETEAFNFITPSSLVTEMMARNGITNELGPIDVAYRAALDAFYQGDYQTAITKFDEALALSPTHAQAQELKVEATKLQASQPSPSPSEGGGQAAGDEGGGFPIAIVLVIVAVAVIGVGAFVVMSRKKKGPGAMAPPAAAPPLQVVGAPPPQPAEAAKSVGFQPTPAATPPQAATPTSPVAPPPSPPMPQPEQPSQPEMKGDPGHFCPNCGHKLEADAHFCPSCGHRIEA